MLTFDRTPLVIKLQLVGDKRVFKVSHLNMQIWSLIMTEEVVERISLHIYVIIVIFVMI